MIRLDLPISPAEQHAFERAKAAICEAAKRLMPHAKLVLFGSRAEGREHRRSDIDLMIIPREGHRRVDEIAFISWLEDTPAVLHAVDLVRWEETNEPLRNHVLNHGQVWID